MVDSEPDYSRSLTIQQVGRSTGGSSVSLDIQTLWTFTPGWIPCLVGYSDSLDIPCRWMFSHGEYSGRVGSSISLDIKIVGHSVLAGHSFLMQLHLVSPATRPCGSCTWSGLIPLATLFEQCVSQCLHISSR